MKMDIEQIAQLAASFVNMKMQYYNDGYNHTINGLDAENIDPSVKNDPINRKYWDLGVSHAKMDLLIGKIVQRNQPQKDDICICRNCRKKSQNQKEDGLE